MIEGVLADEELHLAWLQTEIDLYDRLGEPLYIANRLAAPPSVQAEAHDRLERACECAGRCAP